MKKLVEFLAWTSTILIGTYGLYRIYFLDEDMYWNGFPFLLIAGGAFLLYGWFNDKDWY